MFDVSGSWRKDLLRVADTLSEVRSEVTASNPLCARVDDSAAALDRMLRTLESEENVDPGRLEVLGLLGAGVAHELNNILFVIRGTAEIAKIGLLEGDPLGTKLARIEEAVDRAESLTRMVLHAARPEHGGVVPIPLHPLVKECLKMVAPRLPDTAKVRQQIATDAAAVEVDPIRFFRVVLALFSAAARALEDEGGVLAVTLGPAGSEERREAEATSTVILTVEYVVGEDPSEDAGRSSNLSDPRPWRLSEIDGILPAVDTIVDSIGGIVTGESLGRGGCRVAIAFAIREPPAVR